MSSALCVQLLFGAGKHALKPRVVLVGLDGVRVQSLDAQIHLSNHLKRGLEGEKEREEEEGMREGKPLWEGEKEAEWDGEGGRVAREREQRIRAETETTAISESESKATTLKSSV
eukprot:2004557-Rhodomonas_salina.2